MTTFAIGELPSKMKSLFSVLGLTFLSLTLTNCSLSPEQIASKVKPSIVLLYYKNQPGHGTGFFVNGEPGVCSVLTTAHVVDKEAKIRLRTENDGKAWDVDTVKIFPSTIDLALVTFKPLLTTFCVTFSYFIFLILKNSIRNSRKIAKKICKNPIVC